MEKFYINPFRVTPRIQDLVLESGNIVIDGIRYVELSKRPKGFSVLRKLINPADPDSKITIYK